MDPDPDGPKPRGSGGSGTATLLYRYLVHGYISKFKTVPSRKCIWPPTKGEGERGTVRSSAFIISCRTLNGLTWEKQRKKVGSHGKRVRVSKEISKNLYPDP